MKKIGCVVLGFMLILFLSGCGKQPTQEIDKTKAAVNATLSEGLAKYSPEDGKKLNDALTAAMDEVKVQDNKTFKNYDKAKQMLAEVQKSAEELKAALPAARPLQHILD